MNIATSAGAGFPFPSFSLLFLLLLLASKEASSFAPPSPHRLHQQRKKIHLRERGTNDVEPSKLPAASETHPREQRHRTRNALRIADAERRHRLLYQEERDRSRRRRQETDNGPLMGSFRHVEGLTLALLRDQPLWALALFAAAGLAVAYVSGVGLLGGYISSPNPYENGEVPYWSEEEAAGAATAAAALLMEK